MANIIEITDFTAPELDVYARLTEAQLLNKDHPENGIFIAESPLVIERALDAGYVPLSFLVERKHVDTQARTLIERCGSIPVYTAEFDILTQLTGFQLTRGMLCAMRRAELPSVEAVCANARRIAVLENVMNPTNIGAVFRSAAALNMDAVLLTPGCSNPLYRRAIRVSMGTVFQIPWTYLDSPVRPPTPDNCPSCNSAHDVTEDSKPRTASESKPRTASESKPRTASESKPYTTCQSNISRLSRLGFKTAAMALRQDSVSIDNPQLMSEKKLAVVLGTEGDGLAADTIAECDYTVCIPMSHGVDSLNVAAASAVAFWQLGNRI